MDTLYKYYNFSTIRLENSILIRFNIIIFIIEIKSKFRNIDDTCIHIYYTDPLKTVS